MKLEEKIDGLIDIWHLQEKMPFVPIYEFLKMSRDEYAIWIETKKLPDDMEERLKTA